MKHTNLPFKINEVGLYEITREVLAWIRDSNTTVDGALKLFVCHTSASLLIQ